MPTEYWVYDIIEQLKLRGFFRFLPQGAKPYTRIEVAKSIMDEKDKVENEFEKSLFDKLLREFKYELNFLSSTSSTHSFISRLGVTMSEYYLNQDRNFRFKGRAYGSLYYQDKILVYNSSLMDQNLLDDTTYTGNRFRNFFAGYTEQGYLKLNFGDFSFKFGRDYVKWGYGRGGNLLISDHPIPYDMLQAELKLKSVKYTWFISQLDSRADVNRYLTANRLELNIKNKLYLGLGQAALYDGKSIDLTISNPLAFYYEFQANEGKGLNAMIYFDMSFYPIKNLNFYAEFLIDDWQISRQLQGDLEPNTYAFLVGIKRGDIGFYGNDIQIEYTQVRNRTYNTEREYDKFLRFKRPIAHPLGNDFQSLELWLSQWFSYNLKLTLNYKFVEHGEGRVQKPWDAPWMDTTKYSPATGYYEKFPFGTVETRHTIGLRFFYFVNGNFNLNFEIFYSRYKNYQNKEGERKNELMTRLWFFFNAFKPF